jgi:hypothetical protein
VDGGNPQVAAAGVENDAEALSRGTQPDHAIVLQACAQGGGVQ